MAELKQIVYRGGVVRFRVPAGWVEEYEEDGGGTFFAGLPDSGTLRLNILTFEGPKLPAPSDLLAALAGKPSEPELLSNGNALVSYASPATEAGQDLTIFRWELANAVAPKHLRLALFSYTVLQRLASSASVQAEVALLDREIRETECSPEIGVAGRL